MEVCVCVYNNGHVGVASCCLWMKEIWPDPLRVLPCKLSQHTNVQASSNVHLTIVRTRTTLAITHASSQARALRVSRRMRTTDCCTHPYHHNVYQSVCIFTFCLLSIVAQTIIVCNIDFCMIYYPGCDLQRTYVCWQTTLKDLCTLLLYRLWVCVRRYWKHASRLYTAARLSVVCVRTNHTRIQHTAVSTL